MVKVTVPLGSLEAHGTLGKNIIFQGTTAKVYKAPTIGRKAQAQLDAEDLFQSVTKIVATAGLWVRGYMQSAYGSNWTALIYQAASGNLAACEAGFESWDEMYQNAWRSSSPYEDTRLDCGLVFYTVAFTIVDLAADMGYDIFETASPQMDTAAAVREVWDKTLDGVFAEGIYDDTNASFDYGGVWTDETDAGNYGGSVKLCRPASPDFVAFYFFGIRIAIIYRKNGVGSSALVEVDAQTATFSQNEAEQVYQQRWVSDVLPKGLHRCYLQRDGAYGAITFDGLQVYA